MHQQTTATGQTRTNPTVKFVFDKNSQNAIPVDNNYKNKKPYYPYQRIFYIIF